MSEPLKRDAFGKPMPPPTEGAKTDWPIYSSEPRAEPQKVNVKKFVDEFLKATGHE